MPLQSIDLIYIKRKVSQNEYGENVFSDEESFKGRWDEANNQVSTKMGENLISNGIIYTDNSVEIQPKVGDLVRRENDTDFKPIVGNQIFRNSTATSILYAYSLG